MPIIPQAESKLSDSCAAQVFSLLKKMPLVHYINCHRCAVSSAGDLPLNPCLLIAVGPSVIPCPGAAALARYLAPGTSKVSFIDLVTPLRLLLAACSHRFFRYGTISRMPVRGQRRKTDAFRSFAHSLSRPSSNRRLLGQHTAFRRAPH